MRGHGADEVSTKPALNIVFHFNTSVRGSSGGK